MDAALVFGFMMLICGFVGIALMAFWVWMLIDPTTAWTTGNVVHVDGGQVLGLPPSAGG